MHRVPVLLVLSFGGIKQLTHEERSLVEVRVPHKDSANQMHKPVFKATEILDEVEDVVGLSVPGCFVEVDIYFVVENLVVTWPRGP